MVVMYHLKPANEKTKMYSAGQTRPDQSIIGAHRGVPGVVVNGNLTMLGEWMYNDKPMSKTGRMSLVDTMAGTSAYLGILADTRMQEIIHADFHGVLRVFMRWRRMRGARIHQLAPAVDVGGGHIVRVSDGCLWDNRAIISALHGLSKRGLMNARPLIFVIAANQRCITNWWEEWWSGEKKKDVMMPEATLFNGKCCVSMAKRMREGRMFVFEECLVLNNGTIHPLVCQGLVDLVVLDFAAAGLNSLPFNKDIRWRSWLQRVCQRIRWILKRLALEKSRTIAVAISGGGARTALLGFEFLQILKERHITPAVLAGNSGGAWAIALFAMHDSNTDVLALMRQRLGQLMHIDTLQSFFLMLIRVSIRNPETAETLAYILPLLRKMYFDWRKVITHLLFGSEEPPDWSLMQKQSFLTVFPVTILADSHARRLDAIGSHQKHADSLFAR